MAFTISGTAGATFPDSTTQTTTVNTFTIDEETYNDLEESTNTYSFDSGTTTITISKNAKTYFNYEMEKNEGKRNIKLLKKEYAIQIENELKSLMGT